MKIHPTAIIGQNVKLAEDVEIGPYSVIEGDIDIGRKNKVYPFVHIKGKGAIGEGNEIHTGAVIGDIPQDINYEGEKSSFKIGSNNNIREMVTVNVGSSEKSPTVIGNNNFIMACAHVAHDCVLGDNIVMANATLLAGHVVIFDQVFISGGVVIHQFCRIGRCSMISGNSRISKDVPPFIMVAERNEVYGINTIGMKRNSYPRETINEIKEIYKIYYKKGINKHNAIDKIKSIGFKTSEAGEFIEFILGSERGVC
ncbi:MAG: acyl-ACP--UDP-N-acetylglucosamine O-acyltransferase [Candidatus Aureabacteria bacterium]|nr:acyl-ACP--UDP-N-acetylglucosamine O-acyltransferase [Candidatus Auribacterota bacterium]